MFLRSHIDHSSWPHDPDDPRLGSIVASPWDARVPNATPVTAAELLPRAVSAKVVLIGYPDDEGIRINRGRPGASAAPSEIRKYLYRLTPAPDRPRIEHGAVCDFGDLSLQSELSVRHQEAANSVHEILNAGHSCLSLGGGHDYGFSDGAGYAKWCNDHGHRPLFINFDAHLDVRPTHRGFHSGTPFRRLIESTPQSDLVEVGIQRHCNAHNHLEWLKSHRGRVVFLDDLWMTQTRLADALLGTMGDWLERPRPAFLSIDMDVFSSAFAPGCSQSWATGISPSDFFPAFHLILQRLEVCAVGIYEVSPPLDSDGRTSRLAAIIAQNYIASRCQQGPASP